jgi:threonine dehydrogenase-like Zn-dependent dehydrogenase
LCILKVLRYVLFFALYRTSHIHNTGLLRSIDPLTTIVVSEPALARRQFAQDHGATIVIDPSDSDPATVAGAVMKAMNGIGVDIAFDAAGSQAGLDAALASIRPRGMYTNIAVFKGSPEVNMNLIVMRELTLIGKFSLFCRHILFYEVNL